MCNRARCNLSSYTLDALTFEDFHIFGKILQTFDTSSIIYLMLHALGALWTKCYLGHVTKDKVRRKYFFPVNSSDPPQHAKNVCRGISYQNFNGAAVYSHYFHRETIQAYFSELCTIFEQRNAGNWCQYLAFELFEAAWYQPLKRSDLMIAKHHGFITYHNVTSISNTFELGNHVLRI